MVGLFFIKEASLVFIAADTIKRPARRPLLPVSLTVPFIRSSDLSSQNDL
jgi:hypothetical protein